MVVIMNKEKLSRQIRNLIIFFIVVILFFGITAFPIESEICWIDGHSNLLPGFLAEWLHKVHLGVSETNAAFPFLAYGTDWLAFAHIIIAILFIGPLLNPVKNKWIIDWAIMCCILVFPLALIAGPIREIPFFHRVIDCAFGAIGIIPLLIVRKKIKHLEALG
jgi:hypothetical protein